VGEGKGRVARSLRRVLARAIIPAVHIPDGFLDAKTCVATYCLAGAGLTWAARQTAAVWNDRTIPLVGVMSAFVFAGQMVNFPVAGGTSGHLLGGVLAAVLLGPAASAAAMATVLVVQCVLFQDGGVTALGANVFNLGLVGVWGGYLTYRGLRRLWPGHRGLMFSTGVAAWFSVVLAAALCGLELAASATAPLAIVVPAMTLAHAVIGLGEAAITVAVLSFIVKVRPDLFYEPAGAPRAPLTHGAVVGYGLAGSVGVALLLAPWASSWPDGLERVAERFGFAERTTAYLPAPLADYSIPGIDSPAVAAGVSGLLGLLLVFGVSWLVGRALVRWLRRERSPARME